MPKKYATDSSRNPLDLIPQTQQRLLAFLVGIAPLGFPVKLLDTLRSPDSQNSLYAQGRTKPGAKVTNARADTTYHTKGRAFDLALLRPDGALDWDWMVTTAAMARWEKIAKVAEEVGLKWGGRWRNPDIPHFEDRFCAACGQEHEPEDFDFDGNCRKLAQPEPVTEEQP